MGIAGGALFPNGHSGAERIAALHNWRGGLWLIGLCGRADSVILILLDVNAKDKAMAIMIEIPVSTMRAIYGNQRAKIGIANVERFGIKYMGRQIKTLEFGRNNTLRYLDGAECIGSFHYIAAIDD